MLNPRRGTLRATALALTALLAPLAAGEPGPQESKPPPLTDRTPTELPKIPPPDPKAASVPAGFAVEVVAANLIYPTSIEFDDQAPRLRRGPPGHADAPGRAVLQNAARGAGAAGLRVRRHGRPEAAR